MTKSNFSNSTFGKVGLSDNTMFNGRAFRNKPSILKYQIEKVYLLGSNFLPFHLLFHIIFKWNIYNNEYN